MTGPRILVVDDKEENRYLVEVLLKTKGYEVHSACNGAEALGQLRSMKFDLILSDILMPVMDGFELCRIVKKDNALHRIPFVVLTATYTGAEDENFVKKIGADRFLVKPCEPEELFAAVRESIVARAQPTLSTPNPVPDAQAFKLYNERLVHKLEEKMLALEQETKALRTAEQALRASEWKFRQLYENMAEGVFSIDMQDRIRESNASFQRMLGYTGEELKQLGYNDLTPEKWHVMEQIILSDQVMARGYSEVYEKEYRRKDGSVFPAEMEVFLLYDDVGEQEGIWCIVRDISERNNAARIQKELQDQLYNAQKMESIGRLAGGVAHDFNNMLSVILSYAQMGLVKTDTTSPLHGYFHDILDAGERSAGVTRKLLAFARHQAAAPRVLDLNEIVAGMLKMLSRLIGEKIQLHWHPEANLWSVEIDPSQVDQILANLLVNSRDAIAGTGEIAIETANVRFDPNNWVSRPGVVPGEYVLLTVSDNGCGMSKDVLHRIFEPFFTTKEEGVGTGLGLSTVYGIVKQNNGWLDVESAPGKGTSFKIYLPRVRKGQIGDTPGQVAAIPYGRGETILMVEDEESVLKVTDTTLTGLGYKVLLASSPVTAIEKSNNHAGEIDLLLTDVVMPVMNGRELAELLRDSRAGLKCLYISGYDEQEAIYQQQAGQGVHFLKKPFSVRDLAIKVREALAG
ncbi:response regulator [Desulfobulbus sp.]|uniref:response regulator n=1 Tax=Desulfobulbus sp. TaxID=895 RepID=UPI00286F2B9B|nr:response regulator [Desulfobulbus sp.]